MLGVLAAPGDVLALRRVVHVGQGRVVELQVPAALGGEPLDLVVVGGPEVAPELLDVRVHGLVDDGPDAGPVVHHRRRGDRQLRDQGGARPGRQGAGDRLEEREVLAEDRLVHRQPPGHLDRVRRVGDVPLRVVEGGQQAPRHLGDPADLVHEVHVPGRPPELPVGHRPQPGLPLQGDDLADRLVLDRPQLLVGDRRRRRALSWPPAARRAAGSSRRDRHGTAALSSLTCEPLASRCVPCLAECHVRALSVIPGERGRQGRARGERAPPQTRPRRSAGRTGE